MSRQLYHGARLIKWAARRRQLGRRCGCVGVSCAADTKALGEAIIKTNIAVKRIALAVPRAQGMALGPRRKAGLHHRETK